MCEEEGDAGMCEEEGDTGMCEEEGDAGTEEGDAGGGGLGRVLRRAHAWHPLPRLVHKPTVAPRAELHWATSMTVPLSLVVMV